MEGVTQKNFARRCPCEKIRKVVLECSHKTPLDITITSCGGSIFCSLSNLPPTHAQCDIFKLHTKYLDTSLRSLFTIITNIIAWIFSAVEMVIIRVILFEIRIHHNIRVLTYHILVVSRTFFLVLCCYNWRQNEK